MSAAAHKRHRQRIKRRAYIVISKVRGWAVGEDVVVATRYLRYNPADPDLRDGYTYPALCTCWSTVINHATRFRTPAQAAAVAIQYDGYVVKHNKGEPSYSELSNYELGR